MLPELFLVDSAVTSVTMCPAPLLPTCLSAFWRRPPAGSWRRLHGTGVNTNRLLEIVLCHGTARDSYEQQPRPHQSSPSTPRLLKRCHLSQQIRKKTATCVLTTHTKRDSQLPIHLLDFRQLLHPALAISFVAESSRVLSMKLRHSMKSCIQSHSQLLRRTRELQ